MRLRLLLFSLFTLPSVAGHAADTLIRYPRQEAVADVRSDYFLALLDLALAKTRQSAGDYQLQPAELGMQQERALDSLISNRGVDVVWTITSREREQQLRPIRIPLEKGLYGCRVLLIRTGEQARFDAVQSLPDLATLVAGQGHDWPDTTILRANGLHVETNSNYASSFRMLALGRFDYFPRGVSEAPAELRQHAELNLALERRLLLYYPSAMYFFVNRHNAALAQRLEAGLRQALADGSFDALFRQHPAMREALAVLNQPGRRVLRLNNPLLPEQTPLADKTLWLAPALTPPQ